MEDGAGPENYFFVMRRQGGVRQGSGNGEPVQDIAASSAAAAVSVAIAVR
ncbi:hypothetical protein LDL08_00165 [Nonomuraea glycinis]|uniref:Uncharacterized protein n=1 Tax=Nonomuraea glycinis TaxID=2047744 RepID=A0A917ZZL4_9ACTN|nr:hypothetical protein [Nonomuraea glycinis]MCA2174590.1 hypothetical protein [Nonomuraea glycinis]GGP02075.1 hypothetical protein GCM10012278_07860 [Nonomuraea glycinis]